MGHAHAHPHDHHGHAHDHDHAHSAPRRALTASLALTLSFMVVELVVGIWSGSLALVADAGHMASDAAALGLSLLVTWIAARPRTARHTFGYRRAEVMAALVNAVALGVAAVLLIVEGIQRISQPQDVRGVGMLATAILGLLVNLAAAWILASRGGTSMNVRGALYHVLGDALGSVAAITAGVCLLAFGWTLADPIASIAISALILFGAWRLLRDAAHVLMEGAPKNIDVDAIEHTILDTPGVAEVHDLHVWTLVPGEALLSAHVVLRSGAHGTDVARLVGERLARKHKIHHATIQPEAPQASLVTLRRKDSPSDHG